MPPTIEVEFPARNCALAIEPTDRKDDVKLSGALQRLLEEDGSLILEHDEANHEMRLRGINDEHLKTTLAKLKRRYGVEVTCHAPAVGYREFDPQNGEPPARPSQEADRAAMASSAT